MAFLKKILSVFCLLLVLFSCTSSTRLKGYVYYRLNANPSTLDPALIVDVTGGSIAAKLFNGLVRMDEKFKVIPDIAKSWEISEDGLRYRFYLRGGVCFQNGREVKAGDFKYSFERVLEPKTKSPNTWVFDKVEGATEFREGRAREVKGFRVISDSVFEIRLCGVFSPFLSMLTTTSAYVVPSDVVEQWGVDFSSHPSGTGPFVLKAWRPNAELLLERNGNYFDGNARTRGIVYKIIPEDLTAITDFEVGNLDVVSLPAAAYSKFRNDKKLEGNILSINAPNTYYLGLNSSRPPFSNPEIRRAVSMAIDREKILKTFYEGRGRLADGPVPDIIRNWKVTSDTKDFLKYSPDIAKEMIKKEGAAGLKVNMYVTADQDVVDLAEIIQSYLADVGISVAIKQLEWSAFKQAVNIGESDMFWLSWWADYPDPENFLYPLFHSSNLGPAGNRTRYVNRDVDALIEKGQSSLKEKDRDSFYSRAEEIIIKDAPWVCFWHRTDYLIKQPWIKGYKEYPIYSMDKGMDVEI